MCPIELSQKQLKTLGKVIKTKIHTEPRRLSGQKIVQIVKVHEKTRVKWLSAAGLFSSTKHEENYIFDYSSDALAELLEKTRAKCNLTTIYITSIQNTRENTCRTQLGQQPGQKNIKNTRQIAIQQRAITTQIQIPRENTCKLQPHAVQISQLGEILETFLRKKQGSQPASQPASPARQPASQPASQPSQQPENTRKHIQNVL